MKTFLQFYQDLLEHCECEECHCENCDESCECDCCSSLHEAEYDGRKVTLNKPIRNAKGDGKKFRVYVKNPKTGNIVKVEFGDPNMEIKRDDPARRKSFRARHKCDTAKDKTTARYWSCYQWRADAEVVG